MVKTRSGRGKTPERTRLEQEEGLAAPPPQPPSARKAPSANRRKSTAPEPEAETDVGHGGLEESKPFSPKKETNVLSSPRGRTPAAKPAQPTAPTENTEPPQQPRSPERMPASERMRRSTASERSTSRPRSTDKAARTPLPNDDAPPSNHPPSAQRTQADEYGSTQALDDWRAKLHAKQQRWSSTQQHTTRTSRHVNVLMWLVMLSLASLLALEVAVFSAVLLQPARRAALLEGGPVAVVDGFLVDVQRLDCAAAARAVRGLAFAPLAARAGLVESKCHDFKSVSSRALLDTRPHLQRASAFSAATIKRIVDRLHKISAKAASSKRAQEPSRPQEPESFQAVLPAHALAQALAPCSKEALKDAFDPASMPANKMLSVAVACSHPAECTTALNAIRSGAAAPQRVMHVDGKGYGGPDQAGALQSSLASFLSAYPSGVLILQHLEAMSRECLIVVNNILSENGSLQAEGRAVPTTRGLAVVLSQLPSSAAQPPCNPDLENKVKRQLQRAAAAKEGLENKESSLAKALRRRIDFTVSAAEVVA